MKDGICTECNVLENVALTAYLKKKGGSPEKQIRTNLKLIIKKYSILYRTSRFCIKLNIHIISEFYETFHFETNGHIIKSIEPH